MALLPGMSTVVLQAPPLGESGSEPSTPTRMRVRRTAPYLSASGEVLRKSQPASPRRYDSEVAVDFLKKVDRLVWRRTRPTDVVLSEENVDSLMERLTVWERAVRTRYTR